MSEPTKTSAITTPGDGAPPVVVVFPRGQLSEDDEARMEMSGILCVEADSPKDVHQLHISTPLVSTMISGDDIVRAALVALASQPSEDSLGKLNSAGRVKGRFIALLAESLEGRTP